MLTHFLGAGILMDAYLIAFKFPSFFRRVFSEGGFQSVFVPYINDFLAIEKINGAKYFASRIFSMIFWTMLIFTTIVAIFTKQFVLLMSPGFASDPEKLASTIHFTRIIFPSMTFVALSSVYTSILMAKQKFLAFSLHPIITNIVLILSIVIGQNIWNAGIRISYGILIASIIQFFYLYCCIKKMRLPSPSIGKIRTSTKISAMLKNLLPVLSGASVSQINVFVNSLFSSFLPTGCITYIYIADRIIQLPLALFGISMATILLPEISAAISKNNQYNIQKTTNTALISSMRMTMPTVVWFLCLSYHIISLLYGHGKFLENSVQKTANILICFAISVPAYVIARILASMFFAKKDTKTPMYASIYAIVVNIVLCGILIYPLHEIGIAIATSISGFANMYFLLRKSKDILTITKESWTALAKILISALIMVLSIFLFKSFWIIEHNNFFDELIYLGCICFFSVCAYILSLKLMGDNETKNIINMIKEKFSRH